MFDKLSHFFLRRRNWTLPYALFLLIFAIVPLLLIVLYAFTDADGAFTFANFRKFMMHPEAMNTFIYSIGIAIITTLAPSTRSQAISKGAKLRWAEARAIKIKAVQMVTVTTAANKPTVREERRIGD